MKRLIYVDFENVSTSGLTGLLKLDEKDHVKIFLGPKCSKLSLIEADTILHCNAAVELITNDQIAKNALDFIIMVHLGYDIAKKSAKAYYIISNDKGYEPAMREMQSMTGESIFRFPNIQEVVTRNDVPTGIFGGLFHKKTAVVNATEHEVFERGKSKKTGADGRKQEKSGKTKNGNDRREYESGRENAHKNAAKNSGKNEPKENSRKKQTDTHTAGKKEKKKPVENAGKPGRETGSTHTVSRSTADPKPVKPLVSENRMEELSVRDLVAEMDKQTAPKNRKEEKDHQEKKNADNIPAPLSAEEQKLVDRIISESSTKEEFHNRLMGEVPDKARATDLYKLERAHFNRAVREREPNGSQEQIAKTGKTENADRKEAKPEEAAKKTVRRTEPEVKAEAKKETVLEKAEETNKETGARYDAVKEEIKLPADAVKEEVKSQADLGKDAASEKAEETKKEAEAGTEAVKAAYTEAIETVKEEI